MLLERNVIMSEVLTIDSNEIIKQVKLSCQLPSIIQSIITRKFIAKLAEEKDIAIEPLLLQQTADSLRLSNNLHNADTTWLWLQKHGLSLDEFEEVAYTTALFAKLAQYLFAQRVEPFFFEHQLDYAQVIMYEVVLDDIDLAMELFYTIQEGEVSFHEVAHQYIQTSELRRCGGYRGVLTRKNLKPEISAAVFDSNPPKLLKPILTSSGAHLILVEDLLPPKLTEALHDKIMLDLFSEWVRQQTEQLEVITKL